MEREWRGLASGQGAGGCERAGEGVPGGRCGRGPWVVSEQWGSKTQGCTLVGVGDLFLGDKRWVSLQRPGLLHVCVCVCVTH